MADTARAMANVLAHRGPDGDGVWEDPDAGVALGHRRLSIVDLTSCGDQPMVSRDQRWVLNYNGEVYNHPDIRKRLAREGIELRGTSDTEVLLEAIAAWGVGRALTVANGMFAFALWDRHERTLTMARDRIGEKPLYFGVVGQAFVFASELKALRLVPGFPGDVSKGGLTLLLQHGYVPAPATIYDGIEKLRPGHVLEVTASGPRTSKPYWSLQDVAGEPSQSPMSEPDAVDQLDELIRDSVALRMTADVPLGAFLSGGTDSSLVVAAMQAQSMQPVRTFTIGFEDASYDEAHAARAVAQRLGTSHTEEYVGHQAAIEVIDQLPEMYDEPLADPSQIPTFLVARSTRQHVTVALSGDGGDELFAGYSRYLLGDRRIERLRRLPLAGRRAMGRAITSVPPARWDRLYSLVAGALPAGARQSRPGPRLHRLAESLQADSLDAAYIGVMSHWSNPEDVVVDSVPQAGGVLDPAHWLEVLEPPQRFQLVDALTYLPDDILAKVDRATMAVSLEGRLPLLDHRIVEFSWTLPGDMQLRGGRGKRLLREVLGRYLPAELFERPKMGFAPPVGSWLRGPLREWAESLLDPRRLRDEGYLRPEPVRAAWDEHRQGLRDRHEALWTVLTFQAWLEAQGRPPGVRA